MIYGILHDGFYLTIQDDFFLNIGGIYSRKANRGYKGVFKKTYRYYDQIS